MDVGQNRKTTSWQSGRASMATGWHPLGSWFGSLLTSPGCAKCLQQQLAYGESAPFPESDIACLQVVYDSQEDFETHWSTVRTALAP